MPDYFCRVQLPSFAVGCACWADLEAGVAAVEDPGAPAEPVRLPTRGHDRGPEGEARAGRRGGKHAAGGHARHERAVRAAGLEDLGVGDGLENRRPADSVQNTIRAPKCVLSAPSSLPKCL